MRLAHPSPEPAVPRPHPKPGQNPSEAAKTDVLPHVLVRCGCAHGCCVSCARSVCGVCVCICVYSRQPDNSATPDNQTTAQPQTTKQQRNQAPAEPDKHISTVQPHKQVARRTRQPDNQAPTQPDTTTQATGQPDNRETKQPGNPNPRTGGLVAQRPAKGAGRHLRVPVTGALDRNSQSYQPQAIQVAARDRPVGGGHPVRLW